MTRLYYILDITLNCQTIFVVKRVKMAIRFSSLGSSSLGSGSVWRILSIKVLLTSATVLSMAVLMKASVPAIADFVISEAPSVYGFMNSWLSPLYLYIFVNCIIISIVASSKFQRTVEEVPPVSPPSPAESVKAFGGDVQVVSESATHDPGSPPLGWSGTFYDESWRKDEEKEYGGEEKGALDGESNKLDGDEVEVLRPAKVPERNDSTELLFMNIDEEEEEEKKKKKKKKSPVSGRFPASKSAKYSFEGSSLESKNHGALLYMLS
ncbi:hypothetical protein SAY87_004128 [Trapa incisa]|uniref:DUF4408 domain-containing protein n=1 Tax=Trapa incisa TaxID=236973 RepID=A0AAN7PLB7_9MYRT|nr:hypothetical protein SAY87_004128 [Trapa incisa]